jgi:hypothetical protein
MSRFVVDDFRHSLTLRGSPRRDAFTLAHKRELGPGFYASDVDLVLVDKAEPGIVAFFDCKAPGEPISFAEVIAYEELVPIAPLYVVEVDDPRTGPFTVARYVRGDWGPSPPVVELEPVARLADWRAFLGWELELRRGRVRRIRAERAAQPGPAPTPVGATPTATPGGLDGWGDVEFIVSANNLGEGGRRRDRLEVYLNVNGARLAYLHPTDGHEPIRCKTLEGHRFDARCSGDHRKNFRSVPATALGRWLKADRGCLPGDVVRGRWERDERGTYLLLRFFRAGPAPAPREGGRK